MSLNNRKTCTKTCMDVNKNCKESMSGLRRQEKNCLRYNKKHINQYDSCLKQEVQN